MTANKYLSIDELVERYRGQIKKGTLAVWRSQKKGPPFIKLGKKVLYTVDGVEKWEAKNGG